jgi:hypothetical protein
MLWIIGAPGTFIPAFTFAAEAPDAPTMFSARTRAVYATPGSIKVVPSEEMAVTVKLKFVGTPADGAGVVVGVVVPVGAAGGALDTVACRHVVPLSVEYSMRMIWLPLSNPSVPANCNPDTDMETEFNVGGAGVRPGVADTAEDSSPFPAAVTVRIFT